MTRKAIVTCMIVSAAALLHGCSFEGGEPSAPEQTSSDAQAIGTRNFGYVLADRPSAAFYTPDTSRQLNTSDALNTVTRTGVGAYTVRFPNLGLPGGTVHVTSYGVTWTPVIPGRAPFPLRTPEKCKVRSWSPSSSDMLVNVRCFDAAGAPADAQFVASFATPPQEIPIIRYAYVWADQPSAASYTPNLGYQFNSEATTPGGGPIRIERLGAGSYAVTIPAMARRLKSGIPEDGGSATVTAYGSGNEACKVGSWSNGDVDSTVRVRCFTPSGDPVDTRFTMTFHSHEDLFGMLFGLGSYVLANQPSAASYTPNPFYQYNSADGTITASRMGTGAYRVRIPDTHEGVGHAQVTAYGTGSEHCKVVNWSFGSDDHLVDVQCFAASGAFADTMFTLAWSNYGPF